eukprot:GCRY01001419.1.p1 GENE.GCRY01001419.1~~GCRY01001419.1.p1  ORF type:complete len:327 (+),score=52.44 GCRY01001419.1:223-1203(+)
MKLKSVIVHPLVLLSVVDHYNRVAKDTKKRVVGVLLGNVSNGVANVENSFAVPFEEDERDPSVWFYDHNYQESMFSMFRKVNAREKLIGWYSSGPKVKPNDKDIHELLRKFTPEPLFVIVDVKPREVGIPTEAYCTEIQVLEDGTEVPTFRNLPTEIGGLESEIMVVEHLLRDVKDATITSLSHSISEKIDSMKGLTLKLRSFLTYLENVLAGKLPVKQEILSEIQEVFSLLPNLGTKEMVSAFTMTVNDNMMMVYLASLLRTIIALHDLIENKLALKREEGGSLLLGKKRPVVESEGGEEEGEKKSGENPAAESEKPTTEKMDLD